MNLTKLLISGLFVLSTYVAGQSSSLTLTSQQINGELNKTFPIERQFQEVTAFFTKPDILLDALDEKIEIHTLIRANEKGKSLLAKGKIEGVLEYDELNKVLQFRKPVLDDFEVLESDMDDAQQAAVSRTIRQSMGNNLPKITLVDLNEMALRFPRQQPSEIDVEPGMLTLTF